MTDMNKLEESLYIYTVSVYIYIINIHSIVYTRPLLQLTRGTIRLDLKGRAESMTYISGAEHCMDI